MQNLLFINKTLNRFALAVLGAVLGFCGGLSPVQAAGEGQIAYSSTQGTSTGSNTDIYSINSTGTIRLRLTDDPASDITPCFSADGSKIVFASNRTGNGDIYIMGSGGANQQRLTFDTAVEGAPTISPDGSKVAFISLRDGNQEIYVMNADGTGVPTNITNNPFSEHHPSFSPDGTKIAFTSYRDGNAEIYVTTISGTPVAQRLTFHTAPDGQPTYSPTGNKIAFTSARDGNDEIYVMNADGSGVPTRLTNNAPTSFSTQSDVYPSFSPDGTKITFQTNRGGNAYPRIWVMNASDGSNQIRVSNNSTLSNDSTAVDTKPSWGAGSGIVSLSVNDLSQAEGTGGINNFNFTISLSVARGVPMTVGITAGEDKVAGDACEPLAFQMGAGIETHGDYQIATGTFTIPKNTTSYTFTVPVIADNDPEPNETFAVTLSEVYEAEVADGIGVGTILNDDAIPGVTGKIVYESDPFCRMTDIYGSNADGSNRVRLTDHPNPDWAPSLSRDGSKIVFVSGRGASNFLAGNIYVMDADGKNQRPLTNDSFADDNPVFSPDGTKIAFESQRPEGAAWITYIMLMNADGSNPRILSDLSVVSDDHAPSFSPDGTKIAFARTLSWNGEKDICVMSLDGSSRVAYSFSGDDYTPSFSPNGTEIVFTSNPNGFTNRNVYIRNLINGTVRQVTSGMYAEQPVFSPDGSKIAFVSKDDRDKDDIFIINVDGSGLANVTNTSSINDRHPSWSGGSAPPPGLPILAIGNATIAEGNNNTTNAIFAITLSAVSTQTVTVNYATANGTVNGASAGSDYTAKTGTLTFSPSSALTQFVTVAVNGDTTQEPDETFFVNLSGAANATMATSQGIGTITNDDAATGCSNVFTDSDLESDADPSEWKIQSSTLFGTPLTSAATINAGPQSGRRFAWFGDTEEPEIAELGRSVVLPAGASVNLMFGMRVVGSAPYTDVLRIKVDGTTVKTYSEPTVAESAYSTRVVDLSAYADGEVHIIIFEYTGVGGAGNKAHFSVDDIELEVCSTPSTPSSLQFSVSNSTVNEAGGTATITVTRTGGSGGTGGGTGGTGASLATRTASSGAVSVVYATSNGTATAGSDYTAKTGTLSFAAGVSSQTFTIPITNDTLSEANETITLILSNPTDATLGTPANATLTILDDDFKPTVEVNDINITESNGGSAQATFTLKLSAASTQSVSVKVQTASGGSPTATPGIDYTSLPLTTVTFAPGQTTKTVSVTVLGDTLDENDEKFAITLSGVTNATIADGTGLCTILDNDDAPLVSASAPNVTEGNTGSTAIMTFAVKLSAASARNISVQYKTGNSLTFPATANTDYTAVPLTTVIFAAGETTKMVQVTIKGDLLDEDNERVALNLSNPVNATLGISSDGIIVDDDATPTLSINDQSVIEGQSGTKLMNFTVTLSAVSGRTVTANAATGNGGTPAATAGTDYVALASTPLTFAPGQTTKQVSVTLKGDTVVEANEKLGVILSGAVNATLADNSGIGIILNDDAPGLIAPLDDSPS